VVPIGDHLIRTAITVRVSAVFVDAGTTEEYGVCEDPLRFFMLFSKRCKHLNIAFPFFFSQFFVDIR